MAENRFIPTSLTAKNRPSWPARQLRKLISRIDPELYSQGQNITFDIYGLRKAVGGKFGEFGNDSNPMAINRPSSSTGIDAGKAMANHRGFVYASVNAIARDIMNIDWRLFQVDGKDDKENPEHELLDLLDGVNPDMTGPELKYMLSAHLDLTGDAYWYLDGVKNELDKPTAIYPLNPAQIKVLLDTSSFPFQVKGYEMKLESKNIIFQPYQILHFRLPDPSNPFEGLGVVQAAADYIDNDNYAQEFNRKFFQNGARPAGVLETEFVAESQVESLKIGFTSAHQGVDNMNNVLVLPKGVKWTGIGSNPKDMDFRNLSLDSRDRILAMFGVSKTILGTAESDTNRATAETADYVFSKRVIKPRMILICSFLNEKLVPRYGDDLYITFIDPVPEDRAARTTEMTTSVGGQPVLTINEAREEFMGLGPVDGGEVLMSPTAMAPSGEPIGDGNVTPEASRSGKALQLMEKAANGQRVAFRPARTKLQARAKHRKQMSSSLAENVAKAVKDALEHPTKKFSTKEQDHATWKAATERTLEAEREIAETVRRINAEQYKEVTDNLPSVIEKAIDPTKLFDIEKWIGITTDAMTPIMESLYESEGKTAASELGITDLNPLSDVNAAKALHESIGKMATSYQTTVLGQLEKAINQGLAEGHSLADITSAVSEVYGAADDYGAERIAKTEAFRTTNASLKETWKQSGVVHTIKWYTASGEPCVFCASLDGRVISIDDNFFNQGDSMTVDEKTLNFDYSEVGAPPLHPNCACLARPEDITIN
ncbi:MAG: phage portal protein [Acidobacteriota bacterium]|nr:phage portal protein [Acidobacteriota bacterium]